MTTKEKVLQTIYNHKNCTSSGIANILNVRTFTVLRELSALISEGVIRQQKGRVVEGDADPRFRSYKLIKSKYTPIELFQEIHATA